MTQSEPSSFLDNDEIFSLLLFTVDQNETIFLKLITKTKWVYHHWISNEDLNTAQVNGVLIVVMIGSQNQSNRRTEKEKESFSSPEVQ